MQFATVLVAVLICLAPSFVEPYCRTIPRTDPYAPCVLPEEGVSINERDHYRRAPPFCETCRCTATALTCCGVTPNVMRYLGCQVVQIPGTCRFAVRDADNSSLTCRNRRRLGHRRPMPRRNSH